MADPISSSVPPLQTLYFNHQIERAKKSIASIRDASEGKPDPKLQSASQEMEALFINYLLKEMRATINKSGFIAESRAEQIYTAMLDAEVAKEAAACGGLGLAKLIMDQLDKESVKEDPQE